MGMTTVDSRTGDRQGVPAIDGGRKGATTLTPAAALFTIPGLLFLLATLVVSSRLAQTPILILSGILLASACIARFWARFSLSGVRCRRTARAWRAFPGETVEISLTVSNAKPLPLPWLCLEEKAVPGLSPAAGEAPARDAGAAARRTLSLPPYGRARWRYRLACLRRGVYPLGDLQATSGDPFGFYQRSAAYHAGEVLLVYPRLVPVDRIPLPALGLTGEENSRRGFLEDPARLVGVRAHRPADGFRHIHWKASARRPELQRKVFEPATVRQIALFLAVEDGAGADEEEAFERTVSVAASVACHCLDRGVATGMFVNTRTVDAGNPVILPPCRNRGQAQAVLEALAKTTRRPSGPFCAFLASALARLAPGTTIVLVSAGRSSGIRDALSFLQAAGREAVAIAAGGGGPDSSAPLPGRNGQGSGGAEGRP